VASGQILNAKDAPQFTIDIFDLRQLLATNSQKNHACSSAGHNTFLVRLNCEGNHANLLSLV
jgi:hypothetical protein